MQTPQRFRHMLSAVALGLMATEATGRSPEGITGPHSQR
jgi:hypothetical protein